jgi:hypothetical protein
MGVADAQTDSAAAKQMAISLYIDIPPGSYTIIGTATGVETDLLAIQFGSLGGFAKHGCP